MINFPPPTYTSTRPTPVRLKLAYIQLISHLAYLLYYYWLRVNRASPGTVASPRAAESTSLLENQVPKKLPSKLDILGGESIRRVWSTHC